MSPEDRILIERYLDGQLSGSELQQFMDRLELDSAFRHAVSFQNLLQEGISESASQKIKNEIRACIEYRQPKIPLGLKLIITFLIITAGGIILWNYTGTNSQFAWKKPFAIFKRETPLNQEAEKPLSRSHKKENTETQNGKGSYSHEPMTSPNNSGTENDQASATGEQQSDVADSNEYKSRDAGNMTIRKDQMLVSYVFTVNPIPDDAGKPKEEPVSSVSLGKSAIEKLNPESGLPSQEERTPESYVVEFWVSPVNYKGYKIFHNKIILFGIEEPDMVRLYRREGQLIMKSRNDFYKISPAENFSSFHNISQSEIPVSLQQ